MDDCEQLRAAIADLNAKVDRLGGKNGTNTQGKNQGYDDRELRGRIEKLEQTLEIIKNSIIGQGNLLNSLVTEFENISNVIGNFYDIQSQISGGISGMIELFFKDE